MELPDCPPGAEGYEDSVIEVPKKLELDESPSTKAEQEFLEHLNSLKIKVEDGTTRCMVERRGRDVSSKWIYLCFPCAAVCSGESILQTHMSGKKHETKLSLKKVWPISIFEEHPFLKNDKDNNGTEYAAPKVPEDGICHNNDNELDKKYNKSKSVQCHLQESLNGIKAPMLGLEYLLEFAPDLPHHEPRYLCVLCAKQGHPRTIINHITCFWHRYNYVCRHFTKAANLLTPFKRQAKYREGVSVVINRLAQRVEDTYGRMKPLCFDYDEYEKEKDQIRQWIFKSYHFSENSGNTFEEVVDINLITTLYKSHEQKDEGEERDLSPPVVPVPTPSYSHARVARASPAADARSRLRRPPPDDDRARIYRDRDRLYHGPSRYEQYRGRSRSPQKTDLRSSYERNKAEKMKAPNYEYKKKLAEEKRQAAQESAKKTLVYHEKNPEKHPLYPEEWKKFWNRRYKEIQAEGKDPSKHDFKPEWIVFWTSRMKELHEEELQVNVNEIYRKFCLTPPCVKRRSPSPARRRSPSPPPARRRSPPRRRSPEPRARRPPPARRLRTRSRSRSRSPFYKRARSPIKTRINLESLRRSQSPLSRRCSQLRNRSPENREKPPALQTVLISDDDLKDDDLCSWNSDSLESLGSLPDAKSPPRSRSRNSGSVTRPVKMVKQMGPEDLGPADNVVATLRLLVALEDYLGSLGPKIVGLLTEALKMEKEKANSAEELLERGDPVALLETAKEKLKGAVQAGLVSAAAAPALRAAVVRTAALLHEADRRAQRARRPAQQGASSGGKPAPLAVAGVGAVDKAEIAQQMAAALVAQGKTDVSSEELAQLVDAVVGMAEAKKREAEEKKNKLKATVQSVKHNEPMNPATALQMLQTAYDEYDKKIEKDEAPDAMDGLSDSDLETLLKNFNELSAEEQHSLIAYLKKLEAREPRRVERLREYVSDAAVSAPAAPPAAEPPAAHAAHAATVTIDSDDDDYTVEDVFKSATQKVKEDQMRQEMEVVKKSLEEAATSTVSDTPKTTPLPLLDIGDISSAANLLAMVQASLQAQSATVDSAQAVPVAMTTNNVPSTVVPASTQPRLFGDLPEKPFDNRSINLMPQNDPLPQQVHDILPFGAVQQGGVMSNMPLQNQQNFNDNFRQNVPQNDFRPMNQWEMRPLLDTHDDRFRQQQIRRPPFEQYGQENDNYNNNTDSFRGNFNSGRQDNYGRGPNMNNMQYGNNSNFRGRGRGGQRGRGRGGYY